MAEAKLLEYSMKTMSLGCGMGLDRSSSSDHKAVYVPSEEIFLRPDSNSNVIFGSFNLMYESLMGEDAKTAYEALVEKLADVGCQAPKTVEVSDDFVSWAKAMHQVKNPTADICDLLR